MKFRIDLLPPEYKSLPVDYTGFVLALIAIVLCLSWTASSYMKNLSKEAAVQKQVDAAMNELRELNQRIGALQPPMAQITALKSSIEFINSNLDMPGTAWVEFLCALEAAVPERLYISDINPKDFSGKSGLVFTVNGEAAAIDDVLDFIANLQNSPDFTDVYLKQNSARMLENAMVTSFVLTFTYVPGGKR